MHDHPDDERETVNVTLTKGQPAKESQELAKVEPSSPARVNEWEWETALGAVKLSVDTVQRYFCKNANQQEVMHFLAVCKYHRLNPWLREAYLIKYQEGEPAQIVIGRDTHARRAEEHPMYAGDEGGIIVKHEDGMIEDREGEFYLEPETLVGGWAVVRRKDREKPIVHRIRLRDWDKGRAFWKSSPAHMIAKVARAQARHEAFPTEFSGVVSEDEALSGRTALTEGDTPNEAPTLGELMPKPIEPDPEPDDVLPDAAPSSTPEPFAPQPDQPAPMQTPPTQASVVVPPPAPAPATPAPDPPKAKAAARPAGKVDRAMLFRAVSDKAKKSGHATVALLMELTGKQSIANLSDDECATLYAAVTA